MNTLMIVRKRLLFSYTYKKKAYLTKSHFYTTKSLILLFLFLDNGP